MRRQLHLLLLMGCLLAGWSDGWAGTLIGHVRDPNWFARYQSNPPGVGYYEYAVNANGTGISSPGGADDTDIFGAFQMSSLPAGTYTAASWDVWWRSSHVFGVTVPASGSSVDVDLRLRATMWGYPAFWDETGYHEFGQTFVATGPIAMIYLRSASDTSYTLTVREGGPGGAQVGVARTMGGSGDRRLVYGYGDMPTVAGQAYYVRIRTSSAGVGGVLRQMDPRPDYSDPMPGGCLWTGDGVTMTAHPDRDLGLIIMSDDDGLITDLFCRRSGGSLSGVTSVGQTFVARGVGMISAAFWVAEPGGYDYRVRVLEGGPGGVQVGSSKVGRPARLGADPELMVTWSPGECPLTVGQGYYAELTRSGGGTFNEVFVNSSNPFPFGDAFRNGVVVAGTDLAGTLMEEAAVGSAGMAEVRFTGAPDVLEPDRGTTHLTVRWRTDVAADSRVVYALNHPPYSATNYSATPVTDHVVTLTGLRSHSLYHYQASSSAAGRRTGVFRDQVSLTRVGGTNLLANPGFEEGAGGSPRDVVAGWTRGGSLDLKGSDGSWFSGLPPHSGGWLLQGAVNGGSSDGYIFQRVTGVVPGREYTFSGWLTTWHRENGTYKYDVWDQPGRLTYVQFGIDPGGGTDPDAAGVQWTPRVYSHLEYSALARSATAQGTALTVFVRMRGDGGEWHLYGIDDCALTPSEEVVEGALIESFDVMPPWDSSADEPLEAAGAYSISSFGVAGSCLQAVRTEAGSSARVRRFMLEENTEYLISVHARSPGAAIPYVLECAYKPGSFEAEDHFLDGGSWTVLQRFSNPGENGNTNRWVRYLARIQSGNQTELSVVFALASGEPGMVWARWDELRVDPVTFPPPALALLEGDVIRLHFAEAVDFPAAVLAASYTLESGHPGPAPVVVGVESVDDTTVLLTVAGMVAGVDYRVVVRDVGGAGIPAGIEGLNGAVGLMVEHGFVEMGGSTLWRYEQTGADLGTGWRLPGYDDSGWPEGPALLAEETSVLPEPVRTPLSVADGKLTFYFRHAFEVPAGVTNPPLRLRQVVDDGAIYYLNGVELFRLGVDADPAAYDDVAARVVGNAVYEGPFELMPASMMPGLNLLAVEVHQQGPTSSDVVFGAALSGRVLPSALVAAPPVLAIRREGMVVVLTWDAAGFGLESAPGPEGPWAAVPGADSPWSPVADGWGGFYRLVR